MPKSPTYSFNVRVVNGNNTFYPRISAGQKLGQTTTGDKNLRYCVAAYVFNLENKPFLRDAYPTSHHIDENKWYVELVIIEDGEEYVVKRKKLSTKRFFNSL